MGVWGGLPSILLCDPFTDEDLARYMERLFRVIAPGGAFILGIAGMAMPPTRWERLQQVGRMVKEWGRLP